MKKRIRYSCFILWGILGLLSGSTAQTLRIEGGRIRGSRQGDVRSYKGIPFAAPPVGNLRWQAPHAVVPWKGVRACTAFGPSPMQPSPAPFSMWSQEFLIPKEPISEDCLYLNVWTSARKGEKRPVLIWIYGGGFSGGGSAVPIYDGTAMAARGIVFVSFNYRVGSFGFFAHPELTQESGYHASGNYGLMDQIAALRWVQKNIAAFGGDPANVTIAGQSAGSMSVNSLVASPQASHLFQKAIAESGASFARPLARLKAAEESGVQAMHTLKAASLAELRGKPAAEIQRMAPTVRGPIVDGYILPETVGQLFATRKQNPVVLLTGWNEEEGLLQSPLKTAGAYRQYLQQQYGSDAASLLRFYPATTEEQATVSQYNLSRDLMFGIQNYAWAQIQSQQGQPVYVYRFTRKVPGTGEYARYGAFHTGEVAYAYDNLKFIDRPWQKVDHELARIMSVYWLNFIKTGNPNGKGLPDWPVYENQNKRIMELGDQVQTRPLPDAAALDFLYQLQKQ